MFVECRWWSIADRYNPPKLIKFGSAVTIKGYEVLGWTFFVAPAGTPEPILERLSTEAVRIVGSPEVRKRLSELGLGALGYSRERSAAFLKSELTNWGEAVRISGARVE
ncbi:MAG: tripartite tricarboxylate transporter substrate-binding protein [Proteobacteria bacterium]|nr:tripartite tricarboxylate transporter substrate-binding protein [Pseudomonadota bacterium]